MALPKVTPAQVQASQQQTPTPTVTPAQGTVSQQSPLPSVSPSQVSSAPSGLPAVTPAQVQSSQTGLPTLTPTQVQANQVRPEKDEQDLGWWANHSYAWDSTIGLTTEIQQFMLRHNVFGLGEMSKYELGWDGEQWQREDSVVGKFGALVKTPEEFGIPENWDQMTSRERQKWIDNYREKELAEKHTDLLLKQGEAKGAGALTGMGAKIIADPTTGVALPATGPKLFFAAGTLGGTTTALSTERQTGEVDPVKTAIATVIAGTGGVVLQKTFGVVGQKFNQSRIDKAKVTVHKTVDAANEIMTKLMASGKYKPDEALEIAANKLKITPFELQMSAKAVGRKVEAPDPDFAKVVEQTGLLAKDPVAAKSIAETLEPAANVFNRIVQPISSYVERRSPEMNGRMKRYDHSLHQRVAQYESEVLPFTETLSALDDATLQSIQLNLMNQNFKAVDDILSRISPEASASFQQYKTFINKVEGELKEAGLDLPFITNYFPRQVTDLKSLKGLLGSTQKSQIDMLKAKRLAEINRRRPKNKLTQLTKTQEDELLNDILSGKVRLTSPSKSGDITASRQIATVTSDMLPYYASPVESLKNYARLAATKIEQAKLFGKNNTVLNDVGDGFDHEASLGLLLNELRSQGHLTAQSEFEVAQALQIYFNNGQKSPNKLIAELKSLGYLQTLGNPQSTLTQIKDLGMAAYAQGLFPTIRAAIPGLRSSRDSRITAKQQGLADTIAADFSEAGKVAKALDWVLQKTQFKRVDQFGKNVTMNAAVSKWQKLLQTKGGVGKLQAKYGKAFPEDFDQLVIDLQNGVVTPRTSLLAWHELTRTQPISAYEMPVSYLNNPDLRIAYSLKSFMLKQLQLVRDDVLSKATTNTAEAAMNATRYAVLLNMAGIPVDATKDFILGRPVDMDRIDDYAYGNLLSFVGVSPYVRDKYLAQGDVTGMAGAVVIPAVFGTVNDVVKDVMSYTAEDDTFSLERKQPSLKTLGNLPFVGPYIENYLGGGRERVTKEAEAKQFRLED